MNLVTDPWIPVVTLKGEPEYISLMEVFTEGDKYSDLSVRPHERVALMRLLICIAQAALDGPEDKDDWKHAPKKLPNAAQEYLNKWNKEEVFNLFHQEKPFLQIANLELDSTGKEETSLRELDCSLSSGSSSGLFYHDTTRLFTDSEIAIMILTFQNFSTCGLLSPVLWQKERRAKAGNFDALCIPSSMYHTFLRSETIIKTVCFNLLSKSIVKKYLSPVNGGDAWGKPIWEDIPLTPTSKESIENAVKTYLGRLVPVCRWIKIDKNRQIIIRGGGFKYPMFNNENFPHPPEPSVTIKDDGKRRFILGASHERAIWRELAALTMKRTEDSNGAALTLCNVSEDAPFDIYVGALIRKPGKQPIESFVESVFSVNTKIMQPECNRLYEQGVKLADLVSGQLKDAITEYRKNLCINTDEIKKNAAKLSANAFRFYWTAVEKQRHLLMALVDAWGTESFESTQKAWREAVHKSAREAYIVACSQEAPRQIRAFALGWKKLFMEKKAEIEEQNTEGGEE